MEPFEIWEDPDSEVQFYFSHSNQEFTTGVMVIPAGKALPKHNRPLAVENLVQVSGKCRMEVFNENDESSEYILNFGDTLSMDKGQYHIHSNPFNEPSCTLFKAVGDITQIVEAVRNSFNRIK